MKNKKVLFIVNVDWYFSLHWLERVRYFQSIGYEVSMMARFTSDDVRNSLIDMGVSCYDMRLKRKSLNFVNEIFSFVDMYKVISLVNPDIIHCITIKPNIYGGIINRLFYGKPIVYSITGLGAVFSSNDVIFAILRFLTKKLYRFISTNNSIFIFENHDDYHLFVKNSIVNSNGIVIKGAGIDLGVFSPSEPSFSRNVLFAARLLKDKGLHNLILARNKLKNRGVNFTIWVAGIIDTDVHSAISLGEINKWAESQDIVWLGQVKNIKSIIEKCDVVCLPTIYGEGVPRILIEAASCQRAIITTDVSGCREIVEHGKSGLLAEPNSVNSLADCLEELLLDDSKIRCFGVEGRRKVESEFSQEIVFEKTRQVYNTLLDV